MPRKGKKECAPGAYVRFCDLVASTPINNLTKTVFYARIRRTVVAEYGEWQTPAISSLQIRLNQIEREKLVAEKSELSSEDENDAKDCIPKSIVRDDRIQQPTTFRLRFLKNLTEGYPSLSGASPFVYLISNINYGRSSGYEKRDGGEIEHERLRNYWTSLNYEVVEKIDLTGSQIEQVVRQFHNSSHQDRVRGIVVCSGHGCYGGFVGCDGKIVSIEWIQHKIASTPALLNKAKVIFFHCCRCVDEDYQPKPVPNCVANEDSSIDHFDLYTIFSTSPAHTAYRNPEFGSYFVKIFLDHVKDDAVRSDLTTIMEKVTEEMKITKVYNGGPTRQCPGLDGATGGKIFLPIVLKKN